jgi:hypothetical protein
MTLDLDSQIFDKLVAVLDAIFHEETVADDVVGDVVLDPQVIGAMHCHAAVVGVVNGRVPDVLPFTAVAYKMPVNRVAGKFQVLPHTIKLNPLDIHFAGDHCHDVTAEVGLGCIR